ncbi:hypothetical protein CR513_06256, partial [Mucuna pruriens]
MEFRSKFNNCCIGVSLDRGRASLRLGSQSLSEGTDWDFQRTLLDLTLNAQASEGEPPPSTMAIVSQSDSVASVRIQLSQVEKSLLRSSCPSLYRRHLRQCQDKRLKTILSLLQVVAGPIESAGLGTSRSGWDDSLRKRSSGSLHPFDPKIKKTLNRIKKIQKHAYNPLYKPEPMENNNRTLKELTTSDSYELKSGLIHLLPKFHGLVGEDPHKHLKEFHVVYSMMRP